MRKGTPVFRLVFLAVLMLVCMGGLIGRLWWMQVVRGDFYAAKVRGGSQVTVRIPAVRGEIKDRNGVPLVENRRSFEVDFYLPDIVQSYKKEHGSVPMQPWRRYDKYGNPVDEKEPDIPTVVNAQVIDRLKQLDLEQDYNAESLQVHFRNDREIPFTYRADLDFETMARYLENNIELPGLKAEVKPVRNYPYGALASHILGYVGPAHSIAAQRKAEAEKGKTYDFYQPDMEGRAEIEKLMDSYLKGEAGVRIMQKNAKGQIIEGDVEMIPPKQGADVYLTIDARLQTIVENTLKIAGRAGAVVLDVNNGDVLAMASVPSFDPNIFIPSISPQDWADLNNDETAPLVNRAINAYVPGSTYKVVTSLAGLRAGVGDRRFNCGGGVTYGNTFMACWVTAQHMAPHGVLDLEGGLKNSCNGFFYQYGNAAGIENIDAVGKLLGLGQKSGLGLSGENPGILDGPEHLRAVSPREKWRPGLTANVSIGQGSVLASPLQMAVVAAAIANGGTVYYPRLVDRVVDHDGKVVLQEPAKVRSNLISDGGITHEGLEHVRHGMWRVVNESGGTARKARLAGYEVSGKTGTAQAWRMTKNGVKVKDNNVLFIAFAPYEKPKYAICVLIQGGKSGGGVAAPVAAKILEEAFKLDEGKGDFNLAKIEPAKGSFRQIDSVDFGSESPVVAHSDGETSDSVAPSNTTVTEVAEVSAPPSIRDEPDERGRVEKPRKERRGLLNFFNSGGGKKETNEGDDSPPKRNPFRR